jgi:dihydrofolate reductase
MIVSLVLAVSENGVIGKENQLPWRLPADMKFFKQLTTGHTVIMGRKTYESIGRPLPNRRNMVVSRNEELSIPGVEVYDSLGGALKACIGEDEVFIIGGGAVYAKALDLDVVDRIYLTIVHADFEGDTHFEVPMGKHWLTDHVERHMADEKNPHNYSFVTKTRQREAPLQHATGFGG